MSDAQAAGEIWRPVAFTVLRLLTVFRFLKTPLASAGRAQQFLYVVLIGRLLNIDDALRYAVLVKALPFPASQASRTNVFKKLNAGFLLRAKDHIRLIGGVVDQSVAFGHGRYCDVSAHLVAASNVSGLGVHDTKSGHCDRR